jgi:enoyl-CoA hydratase
LILTGRSVDAQEALAIGLANRVVPNGKFPQACLRHDRASVFEQQDLSLLDALANEFRHGRATLESGESVEGASRFVRGAGRHGEFGS